MHGCFVLRAGASMKLGHAEAKFKTTIKHHEWDIIDVAIEQGENDSEPVLSLYSDVMTPSVSLTLNMDELADINALVNRFIKANSMMRGE